MRAPKGTKRLEQQREKLEALQREEDSLIWDMDGSDGKKPVSYTHLVLYDPPYSQRQVKECYDGIGIDGWDGRMTFWSEAKNEIARIVKPGGKVICFGWNSMGCGAKRGFSMERVLIVPHGGSRNDTICTVEIKKE